MKLTTNLNSQWHPYPLYLMRRSDEYKMLVVWLSAREESTN